MSMYERSHSPVHVAACACCLAASVPRAASALTASDSAPSHSSAESQASTVCSTACSTALPPDGPPPEKLSVLSSARVKPAEPPIMAAPNVR